MMGQLDGTGMKRLHREWRHRTEGRLALVLDNVANPFNVGSIVRTAAAERVDHLYLGGGTAPSHSKANKTALAPPATSRGQSSNPGSPQWRQQEPTATRSSRSS